MSSTQPNHRLAFRSLIRNAAANPANRSSVLADKYHECPYPEIVGYLEEIQSFLSNGGVTPHDCVTVELSNSVRGALLVQALLDASYSFMAIPVPGQGARAGGASTAQVNYAKFTRWILSVKPGKPAAAALAQCPPSSYIEIKPNPDFDPAASRPDESNPRLYFRTSGSLGAPKLAVHRYDRFHDNALNALKARRFNPSHRIALPTPIFHVYGLGAALLPGIAGGSSIDLQERSNLLIYLEREAEFDPNVAYVTPPFCETLIRGRRSPRAYQFIVTSGDRISESAFRRSEELHGTMISQYGTTEMGVVSACSVEMPYDLRSQTVGRTVEGVEIRIAKSADAQSEDRGELQIRHAYGFEGYVDLGGKTLVPPNAFDGEWYRTGDLAMQGPDDTLIVLGRCDLSVNRSGVLLPLAEVESRMRDLKEVEEVAVVLGADTIRGRELIAYCTCPEGVQVSDKKLLARYAQTAPPFSVPDRVVIMEQLPKLPSGKIDRRALAQITN
jgi:acyl-coenzyme A synthetase/AMP-(fatty) acid ligase